MPEAHEERVVAMPSIRIPKHTDDWAVLSVGALYLRMPLHILEIPVLGLWL